MFRRWLWEQCCSDRLLYCQCLHGHIVTQQFPKCFLNLPCKMQSNMKPPPKISLLILRFPDTERMGKSVSTVQCFLGSYTFLLTNILKIFICLKSKVSGWRDGWKHIQWEVLSRWFVLCVSAVVRLVQFKARGPELQPCLPCGRQWCALAVYRCLPVCLDRKQS